MAKNDPTDFRLVKYTNKIFHMTQVQCRKLTRISS
jgi:hypothetical protein